MRDVDDGETLGSETEKLGYDVHGAGSGGEGRCVVEIFYISVSLDTHTSRHHWGVIVPLGARHVSRPSRHRSIGPGVTTLGSIVLDDCQWAESGKCGPILMMMPDTCFPRE